MTIIRPARSDRTAGGGPTTVRSFLEAGLVDHLHVVQVPILLGRGVRLWDGLEGLEDSFDVEAVSTRAGSPTSPSPADAAPARGSRARAATALQPGAPTVAGGPGTRRAAPPRGRAHAMTIIRPARSDRTAGGGRRARSARRLAVALALVGAAAAPVGAADAAPEGAELAEVRAATAKMHRIEAAEADGHQLGWQAPFALDHCISHPTDGAMGYHWFDHDAITDLALDPLEPEGLVYAPGPNGQLRLVAVEWIVPADAWHAAGNVEPPSVLGQELHVLNPALGWYILHAWVWKPNPAGTFQDWNPDVTCP